MHLICNFISIYYSICLIKCTLRAVNTCEMVIDYENGKFGQAHKFLFRLFSFHILLADFCFYVYCLAFVDSNVYSRRKQNVCFQKMYFRHKKYENNFVRIFRIYAFE